MRDDNLPDRRINVQPRKTRLTVGTASVPAGIVVCWVISNYMGGKEMPQEVAMSVGAIVGSITSVLSLCFQDLRGIFLARFRGKREEDRK